MKTKKIFWKLQENVIDHSQINELINFIKTTERYTQFEKVRQLEEAWSKWQGCKYSVFVNSGSSANLIILDFLRDMYKWKAGDEIIVPAITWITDISTILQFGLTPVFVDVNLEDFCLDYNDLASKITPKTRAVFVTHLLGFPGDIPRIKKIIGKRNIKLIEDCCEAHGAKIGNVKVGNFGVCSSFSFYWGHHMTTVEGGMVSTNDEKIYRHALLKRSHGLARELPKKYHQYYKSKFPNLDFNFLFLTTGFNVRNTELSAVLGLSQLKKLDSFINVRNKNHRQFVTLLKNYSMYFHIPDHPNISSFCLPLILKDYKIKKPLQKYLSKHNIESRPIISGNLLKQPFLKKYALIDKYPNADFIHKNGFYIGNNQFVNPKRLSYFDNLLKSFFDSQKKTRAK